MNVCMFICSYKFIVGDMGFFVGIMLLSALNDFGWSFFYDIFLAAEGMLDIKDNSGLFFYYTRFVLILIPETLLSTGFRIEGID